MTQQLKTTLILIMSFVTVFCFADYNALKPAGNSHTLFNFAKDGKSLCYILIPQIPTSLELKAANELSKYLQDISGASFEVVKKKKTLSMPFISVGRNNALSKSGIILDKDVLQEEGYGIQIRNGNLFLYGASHWGPLFAVVALLEEDIGCRWYTHKWSKLPKIKQLSVEIVSRVNTPAFRVRDPFSWISNLKSWSWQNRIRNINPLNHLNGHLRYQQGWWCHTYNSICNWNDFKEYPERFMLDPTGKRFHRQLCPSNAEVKDLAVKKVLKSLKANKNPEASFISISQNDYSIFCHCSECQKINKQEGTPLGAHFILVNYVANAIKQEYPNITITFLAYHHTQQAPKHFRLASNVVVRLCTTFDDDIVTGTSGHVIPVTQHKVFLQRLKKWGEQAKSISIWDYQVDFKNYLRPFPSIYAMSENIKCYADNKVSAVMIQGAYQCPGGERQGMRAWVLAKLLWNPKLNTEQLMLDYIFGIYGPAGKAMNQYNQLIYQAGKHGKTIEEYYGVKDFIAKSQILFSQAGKALEQHKRVDLLNRVALAELPLINLELNYIAQNHVKSPDKTNYNRFNRLLKKFEEVTKEHGITEISEGKSTKLYLDILTKTVKAAAPAESWLYKDTNGESILIYKLSSLWKYNFIGQTNTYFKQYYAEDFDDTLWRYMRDDLGIGWEEQGMGNVDGNSLYRNYFRMPEQLTKRYYYLYFIGCDEEVWTYVNGEHVGERTVKSTGLPPITIWNMPFAFDVKQYLHSGKNSIALRIYDSGYMGGLYMPVFIVASNSKQSIGEIAKLVNYKNLYNE